MKKYLAGLLTGVLLFALALSALAISGRMTIDVDPVNIQVNGQTFVPKDVNGKEVPVFAYEGTTYAPLRALAEAYGLEVGYDASTNMATVADPDAPVTPTEDTKTTFGEDYSDWSAEDEAAYQEFKAMWKYEGSKPSDTNKNITVYKFRCESISDSELEHIRDEMYDYVARMIIECAKQHEADVGDTVIGRLNNIGRGFYCTVDVI